MTDEKPRYAPPLDPTKDWVKQPEGHYAVKDKLLPLPRPACVYADERHPAYTAVQMQEYARACLAARRRFQRARDERLSLGTGKRATRARARLKGENNAS